MNHFLQKVFPCVTLQVSMKIFSTFRVEVLFKWAAVATINKESQDNSTKFNIQNISHILTKPEQRAKKTEQKTAWRRKTTRLRKKHQKIVLELHLTPVNNFWSCYKKKNSNKQSCSPKHELFTGTTWESLRGLMVKPWNMNQGPKFKSCQACGFPCLFPFFLYFTTTSYHNKHLFKPLKDESFFSNRGQNIVHNSVWQGYK